MYIIYFTRSMYMECITVYDFRLPESVYSDLTYSVSLFLCCIRKSLVWLWYAVIPEWKRYTSKNTFKFISLNFLCVILIQSILMYHCGKHNIIYRKHNSKFNSKSNGKKYTVVKLKVVILLVWDKMPTNLTY